MDRKEVFDTWALLYSRVVVVELSNEPEPAAGPGEVIVNVAVPQRTLSLSNRIGPNGALARGKDRVPLPLGSANWGAQSPWTPEVLDDAVLEAGLRHPSVLILLDIDKFKLLNASFGHPAGDRVLNSLAQLLYAMAPSSHVVGAIR